MTFSDLSVELKEVLEDVLDIDESTQSIPIFTRETVEAIFWKLIEFDEDSAKNLAEELSSFISSLGRAEDQILVTAEITRPSARVTESDITLIEQLSSFERLFHNLLEQQERSPKTDMGLLLFSAARYGGLLNEHNLVQFFHKLRNAEPPKVIGKTAWYAFRHDIAGNVIWLPDPLTLALITNWFRHQKFESMRKQSAKRYGWHHYVNNLARIDDSITDNWQPKSLLRACSVRLAMDIAPALVDIASGKTPTCAFNEHTWLRLLTEKSPALQKAHKQKPSFSKASRSLQIEYLQSSFDIELLKRLGHICKRSIGGSVQHCIDEIREEHETFAIRLSPNLNLLLEWMIFRVLNAGSWSGPLKLSSAKNRLELLYRTLRANDETDDVMLHPDDGITKLYENIIQSYQSKRQAAVARALRDFHDFLVRSYGVEPNYTPDKYILVDSRKNKALSVDAEVLMPWDYLELKSYLTRIGKSFEHQDISRLVLAALILGYRAGLRRSEVHYLRVKDFSLWTEKPEATEIIIKEHSLRTLKSPSAYRRIKVGALLTPQELRFLLALLSERQSQDGSDAFVFRTLSCERPYVSTKILFEPLAQLLKQVTGNPAMRYHHLRHSAATWNFWRWLTPSTGKHSAVPTLGKLINLNKVATERQAILGVRKGLEPSRKTLHALSMIIGHSHPTTTLRHYIHSSHITLHDQLCMTQPRLKKKVLAKLSGLSSRGLRKSMRRQAAEVGEPETNEWKASSIRDNCLLTLSVLQDKNIETKGWRKKSALNFTWLNREPGGERIELIDYYLAAKDYFEGYESVTWLENRYAIFGATLNKVLEQAKALFKLQMDVRKGNGSVQRSRHWERIFIEQLDPLTGEINKEPEYLERLPELPRQIRERMTLERMLLSVDNLNNTQKLKLAKVLNYFVNNSDRRSNGVSFRTRRSLDAFVSAVRLLELSVVGRGGKSAERLRLTISAPEISDNPEKQKALEQYWNKSIGFASYQFSYRNRNLSSKYKHGLANIDLMSVEAKTSDTKPIKRRVADAGFRIGLYMLYITQPAWANASKL
ncbi:MAG: hypothetical protein ACQEVQ_06630 [Pseudomonadota bacterium]